MAESASSASLGPRYAPEDPTLPKPWMGLIDGSTGLQYYWNPESNVTQYERPAPATPPLPPGPPPATTPNLSPLPVTQNAQQPNGSESYTSQQFQQTGQPVQLHDRQIQHPHSDIQLQSKYPRQQSFSYQGNQLYQQSEQQSGQSLPNGSQPPPTQSIQIPDQQIQHLHSDVPLPSKYAHQQSYSYQGNQLKYQQSEKQSGQTLQQLSQQHGRELHHQYPGEQLSHQQPGQQVSEHTGQQYSHQMPGQQLSRQQPGQHASYQQPNPHLSHHQSSQNILQQIPYQQIPYQQAQQPPGQQIVQNIPQGGFKKVDDFSFPQDKQDGYTTSESHPSRGISSKPSGLPQVQPPHSGVRPSNHQDGFSLPGGSQLSSTSYTLLQKNVETVPGQHQQIGIDSRPQNQMLSRNTDYLMPLRPPMAPEEGENQRRAGGDFYNRSKEVSGTSMLQPKLAAIPVARNLQETRAGAANTSFLPPGHPTMFNMPPAHHMSNMYESAVAVQPFPNGVATDSSPIMHVPSNLSHVSAADAYRNQHEVSTMGENIPAPFMTFEATGFPPEILREMHFAGFTSPTPIQAQTWPIALQGRDIVAIAKTGSGKTLGYLVPAFLHLRRFRDNRQIGPSAVVLAPTRELASQIQDEAVKFGRSSGISSICLYGGAPKGPQLKEIERGADIVVATPGRLNDFLEMSKINLRQVSFLVLDEADRMLDMGFEPQIRKIVDEVPRRRQTLMYTATWPKEVRKIAGDLLVNPVQVNIGSIDELAANKSITQYVEVLSPMDKQRRLEQILRAQEHGSKIIIFCSTKKLCDQLARGIGRTFGAIAIHGDKSQGERDWALNQFRTGKLPILVATDVAARGLDIKDIRVVINYDFPTGIEDYVHRIGRTGRAGATGVSYTFLSDHDWKFAADLIKVLEGANQRVPIEVREMAARGAPAFSKGRGGRWDSGGGRWDSGGGRWNSGGGRGMRDGGVPGDSFGGRGGRSDFMGGRTNRGRGFGGPGGWGRGGRGPNDRYGHMDGRGGRFDNQRQMGFRNRGRSYSRSPERGRNWRSRSPRSRSRSWSRSRSRSRSYSRSYSRSRSNSRSRSRTRSLERYDGRNQSTTHRVSGFDILPATGITNPPPSRDVLPTSLDITGTNNSLSTDSNVHMEPASVVPISASAPEEPNPI